MLNAYLFSISSFSHAPFHTGRGPFLCLPSSLTNFPHKAQDQEHSRCETDKYELDKWTEEGKNGCSIGRLWCLERTQCQHNPGLRAQPSGASSDGFLLLADTCAKCTWTSVSIPLPLMGGRWYPGYPSLHRITWFQLKSVASYPPSCGLTMTYTTFCIISDVRTFLLLQTESFCRRKPTLLPLWPSCPISELGTQELSKYLSYEIEPSFPLNDSRCH